MSDVSGRTPGFTYFTDPGAPPTMDPGAGFAWAWNGSQWVRSAAAARRQPPAPSGGAAVGGGATPTRGPASTPAPSGRAPTTNLRDRNNPPSIPAGSGFAWAWNPTLNGGQWVRSAAEFNRQQREGAGGSTGSETGSTIETGPVLSEQSARSIIRDFLTQIGLPELEDLLYQNLVADADYSPQRLAIEVRRTPQYARRFPGMAARQAAGAPAITEAEYIAMERGYEDVMRRAGLPTGFYDSTDDFAQFIGNDISVSELSTRVQQGYQAVAQADPSVLATMRQFYGVTDGELAAYFLDPTKAESVILQQVGTAQIGAAAAREGFGQAADRAAAERMQRFGVTGEEASQAFSMLNRSRELLTPLERGETALDVTETALGLTGRGGTEAAQRLATQQRRRVARFEGGGRFATTGQEVTGLRTT